MTDQECLSDGRPCASHPIYFAGILPRKGVLDSIGGVRMQHTTCFLASRAGRRLCFLLTCAFSILCVVQGAVAQSGRRPAKVISPSPPVVTPDAASETKVKTPKPKPAPVATLAVGGDRQATSFDLHPSYLDLALNACIERLQKSAGLAVNPAGSSMNRKDAIDRAKRQNEEHVVWLEMKVERTGPSSSQVVLEYSVYEPQTAKLKNSGRVYMDGTRRVGGGPIGIGVPSVSRRLPLDYLAREAGLNVAERVLDLFRVDTRER
jgi:hypothetical protein